jgi:hypothetical protein
MGELLILEWLRKKYVQRADERQKAMGLQYTEAETHDLAREFYNAHVAPLKAEIAQLKAGGQVTRGELERLEEFKRQVRENRR